MFEPISSLAPGRHAGKVAAAGSVRLEKAIAQDHFFSTVVSTVKNPRVSCDLVVLPQMPFRRLLPLVLLLGLSGCKPAPEPVPPKEETGATDSAVEKTLPLSPGIRAASLISGGIAGISNSIQITYDWKLVVISDDLSFIRPLDGEEQKKIHAALKPFRTLHYVLSNGVPDAFSSIIVSLGTGEGGGNRAGSCATR